jgi:hypothetical protein
MTLDEFKPWLDYMRSSGVRAFQVTDKGVSVVFGERVDKPVQHAVSSVQGSGVTQPKEAPAPRETFDGMDVKTLLGIDLGLPG